MVREQYCREGYSLSYYLPVTFTESGCVSVSLQPENIPDWKWSYNGFCYKYVRLIENFLVYSNINIFALLIITNRYLRTPLITIR